MLNKTVVAVIIVFSIVFIGLANRTASTPSLNTPTNTPTPHYHSDRILWDLINEWQQKQGWQPYIESQKLCEIADKRVVEIQTDYSHKGFEKYWDTFEYQSFSENISEGYNTEQEVLNAWLASPSHKKALTSFYPYSCLRCQNNMCVQLFVRYQ